MTKLPIKILEHGKELTIPYYATTHSAGLDLLAAINENITLGSGEYTMIPTGMAIALPDGYEGQIRPRSGLAAKFGVTVLNSPGTIDADYRGEIKVLLINHGANNFVIEPGMRIAQMVIAKYERVELHEVSELDNTDRGYNGFGSTGH